MALQCQVSLNYAAYTAGQNPAPMATITAYNASASPITVTSIQMKAHALLDPLVNRIPMLASVPPTGPGMTTSVPALSSITIGPFPIVIGSSASANSFAMLPPGSQPSNPQGSQPPQTRVMIGALVYGSDGSVNEAGETGLLLSYAIAPPLGYQGGDLNFAGPNNLSTGFLVGIL